MENGTNTDNVTTSWMIFNCGRVNAVMPMRLAGTWIKYSNNAMLQLTIAAMYHLLFCRFLRCPYHAKVMKRLDKTSNEIVCAMTDIYLLNSRYFCLACKV